MYAWPKLDVFPDMVNREQLQYMHAESQPWQTFQPVPGMYMPTPPQSVCLPATPQVTSALYKTPAPATQQLPPEDYPSDDSSDPHGHDLGFLSLSHETACQSFRGDEDGNLSDRGGQHKMPNDTGRHGMDIRQRAQAANLRARYNCVGSMHSPDEKSAKDSKRGKGRPVGSKDRQPRIKRPATSPLPSERQDKGAGMRERQGRRKPWMIILTAEQAVEIYTKRNLKGSSHATSSCISNEVAEQYGVNSKTIRDIWNRATWVKATRPLWTEEEEALYVRAETNANAASEGGPARPGAENAASGDGVVKRTRGRPKGSRDLRPRVKRKSDTWDEVEGESGGRYKGAAHAQMAERHGGQMAGPDAMGVGVDLHGLDSVDLYGVFSKTGAVAVQQRTWRGKQSSSNTSHSQSSSYTNDDSHSGDQGSDSGGSRSGHSPTQAASPTTFAARHMAPLVGVGSAGMGNMPMRDTAWLPGLMGPMDPGHGMLAHAWGAGGLRQVSNTPGAAHAPHHVAPPSAVQETGRSGQDLSVYPVHHPHGTEGFLWVVKNGGVHHHPLGPPHMLVGMQQGLHAQRGMCGLPSELSVAPGLAARDDSNGAQEFMGGIHAQSLRHHEHGAGDWGKRTRREDEERDAHAEPEKCFYKT